MLSKVTIEKDQAKDQIIEDLSIKVAEAERRSSSISVLRHEKECLEQKIHELEAQAKQAEEAREKAHADHLTRIAELEGELKAVRESSIQLVTDKETNDVELTRKTQAFESLQHEHKITLQALQATEKSRTALRLLIGRNDDRQHKTLIRRRAIENHLRDNEVEQRRLLEMLHGDAENDDKAFSAKITEIYTAVNADDFEPAKTNDNAASKELQVSKEKTSDPQTVIDTTIDIQSLPEKTPEPQTPKENTQTVQTPIENTSQPLPPNNADSSPTSPPKQTPTTPKRAIEKRASQGDSNDLANSTWENERAKP